MRMSLAGSRGMLPESGEDSPGLSTIEFHAPQAGHLPTHLRLSLPHCVQKNDDESFAINQLLSPGYKS